MAPVYETKERVKVAACSEIYLAKSLIVRRAKW